MLKKSLQKMSEKIESRLLTLRWRHLLYVALTGVGTFVLITLAGGVLQDLGVTFWKASFLPWFGSKEIVSNGSLVLISLGWFLACAVFVASWGWYGLYNRTAGQLEEIKRERMCDATPKEVRSSAVLDASDRQLFLYLTSMPSNELAEKHLIDSILQRTFEIWGTDTVYRAAVYLPKEDDPDYLTEYYDEGVGDELEWYIGKEDPTGPLLKKPRGIPGSVYWSKKSRVDTEIRDDPDFYNRMERKREDLPRFSAIYALIHPDDEEKRLGILCFESERYTFNEQDLILVEPFAIRLAWLLKDRRVKATTQQVSPLQQAVPTR